MNSTHLVLIAAVAVLGSCAHDDDPQHAAGADMNAYCEAVCARFHECDNMEDQSICANLCENDTAATAPKLRGDYMSAYESCLLAGDCASLLDGTRPSACFDEVLTAIAPSAAGTDFCSAWTAQTGRCGSMMSETTCLEISKQYNDAALTDARSCVEKDCALVVQCIGAALAIELGPGGGAGPDSCVFAFDGVCDEPEYCATGTDSTDCGGGSTGPDSCVFAFDGVCDEPQYCAAGTDSTDCGR